MIVLSRHRVESERRWGDALAKKFNIPILSIPFLYDLRSFGPTVQRLRELTASCIFIAPLPVRSSSNLLNAILKPRSTYDVFSSCYDSTAEDSMDRIVSSIDDMLNSDDAPTFSRGGGIERIEEPTVPRWYPVIDKSRCCACLECVNFCLFGVYVIGTNDLPIVDQPDACRDGCPACSRVCPSRAIMFPLHEDPIIAGYVDAPIISSETAAKKAAEERQRHFSADSDGLDDLVDRIDQFLP